MEVIGTVNDRIIYLLDAANNFFKDISMLRGNAWIALVYSEAVSDINQLSSFATACLLNNAKYVCCVGDRADLIEDVFDECGVQNGMFAMTTSHQSNFEEAFWFACKVANFDNIDFRGVACISMDGNDLSPNLKKLIGRINTGWLPEG